VDKQPIKTFPPEGRQLIAYVIIYTPALGKEIKENEVGAVQVFPEVIACCANSPPRTELATGRTLKTSLVVVS
jgi:hypothetical protein